ncbi:MAG: hypothetical protein LM590_08720, partial [Thermofilum sp.]|nr:hypothetical protein [Thermofilum sp.]
MDAERCTEYWCVVLNAYEILKLAERYAEWRHALRKFVERKRLEPTTLFLRRLLELAESSPLPHKAHNPPFPRRGEPRSYSPVKYAGLSSRRT